jgi:hypothetical protein
LLVTELPVGLLSAQIKIDTSLLILRSTQLNATQLSSFVSRSCVPLVRGARGGAERRWVDFDL